MLNLIVGCGGTGLATIEALCERLVYSRKRKFAEYAFLAIDSDVAVLADFANHMRRLLGDHIDPRPIVETVQLGRGYGINDVVAARFNAPFLNGNNPEGRERLRQHWWHDANGQPYGLYRHEFHNAIDCYGMTWHELAGIDKIALDVIHYIAMRSGPLYQVNVHVISSLAGTTGRGCWSLVAFKIREMLLKEGIVARQTGILFDAMAFEEFFHSDFRYELRCKVNSLTGLSELSCWEDNEKRNSPICFNLPSLSHPQSEETDLIRTEGNLSLAEGPIDELRLIGRDGRRYLSWKDHVNNAADALYLEMTSTRLVAKRINQVYNFSSASVESSGSATFEVNIDDIVKYCSTRAYGIALAGILDSDEDVSPMVAKFFEALPINTTPSTIGDIRPNHDGQGSIFQRLSFELVRQAAAQFEYEKEQLPRMGRDEAFDMPGAIIGKTPAECVEEALKKALIALGIEGGSLESVSAFVKEFAMRVFSGDQEGKCSIGRLRNFLQMLRFDIAKSFPYPEKIDPPETAAKAIARLSSRTLREKLLGRPRLNADEMAELIRIVGDWLYEGIIVDQFLSDAYGKMLRVVRELVNCVLKKVDSLISAVVIIEKGCRTVCDELEKQGYDCPDNRHNVHASGEEAFSAIFVLPDRCLDAIVDESQDGRSRILKPIEGNRESLDSRIRESLSLDSNFGVFLNETIERLSTKDPMKFESERLECELSSHITSNVFLHKVFFERNFTFLEVLSRNRDYWNEKLKREGNGNRIFLDRDDRFFLNALGTVPVPGIIRELPPVEALKDTIIDTFPKRLLPSMEVNRMAKMTPRMTVLVPFEVQRSRRDDTTVEIIDLEDDASSPYAYLGYVEARVEPQRSVVPDEIGQDIPNHGKSTKGPSSARSAPVRPYHVFDAFQSLEYYWKPEVLEKLKEVEREDGKSIFAPNPRLGPIGYVSPIYVRDADWSAARWKPWALPMQTDVFHILQQVMRLNRDNGRRFTRTDRLDEIQRILSDSPYRRVNLHGLFHLYAKRPLDQLAGPVVLVSSHVDCESGISRCFCEETEDGLLRGTFDNAATNAAVLSLMLEDVLPDHVLVTFTGDEEEDSHGIIETVKFLRSKNVAIRFAVVLDVTDMGWKEHAGFTVENNFWDDALGRRVIKRVGKVPTEWRFVPEDLNDIPDYVPPARVVAKAAEPDETWDLDDLDVQCFSLCLPVNGEMHSDRGVLAERTSFPFYCAAIKGVLEDL